MNPQIIEKLSTSSKWVGKIALFDKALLLALACLSFYTCCQRWQYGQKGNAENVTIKIQRN